MRQAFVDAPASPPAGGRLPVVLAFHGRGDNIRDFQCVNLHVAWRDVRSSSTSRRSSAAASRGGKWSAGRMVTGT